MAILGLRDIASYASQRFENWRRAVLYAFPNGAAPLTAFLSLTKPEETNDAHFHWNQKTLPTQRAAATAAYTDVATQVLVASAFARVGHLIMNETTKERMQVVAVTNQGLTLTVERGHWGAAAASSTAADNLIVIGNVNPENGETPSGLSYDPDELDNYCQTFRTPIRLSGRAMKTAVKWDKTGPYKELTREALSLHSIEQEKAYLVGAQASYTDPVTGENITTTDGVISVLPAGYQVTPADGGGAMTGDEWSNWLELVFRVCSNQANEKLALVGSGALNALNRLAEKVGKMETVAGDETFGMALIRWYTPFGTLYLRTHPLFTQHPTWRYQCLILDVHNLVYRYMTGRDTQKLTNRQGNGTDGRVDEFFTDSGLEMHHVGTGTTINNAADGSHLLITNMKSATASA